MAKTDEEIAVEEQDLKDQAVEVQQDKVDAAQVKLDEAVEKAES